MVDLGLRVVEGLKKNTESDITVISTCDLVPHQRG